MTPEERAEVLVTARLLRAVGILRWLAAALIVVAAASMIFVKPSAASIAAILLGLLALYYGIRVAFDAHLLDDIALDRMTTADLDHALGRTDKTERSWADRCRGAKRLVVLLAGATVAEIVAVVLIGCS